MIAIFSFDGDEVVESSGELPEELFRATVTFTTLRLSMARYPSYLLLHLERLLGKEVTSRQIEQLRMLFSIYAFDMTAKVRIFVENASLRAVSLEQSAYPENVLPLRMRVCPDDRLVLQKHAQIYFQKAYQEEHWIWGDAHEWTEGNTFSLLGYDGESYIISSSSRRLTSTTETCLVEQ